MTYRNLNYHEAKRILDGYPSSFKPRKKRTRPADSVKLANNTYLVRYGMARIGLELHGNTIVTFTPHWMEFDTCGWPTMTTSDRMRMTPVDIHAQRNGWSLFPATMRPCYTCKGTKINPHANYHLDYDNGPQYRADGTPFYAAVWTPAPCDKCDENGQVPGHDWASGGHPFFDGIRTDANGTRLLKSQPRKPATFRPVKTGSGFEMSGYGPYDHRGFAVR